MMGRHNECKQLNISGLMMAILAQMLGILTIIVIYNLLRASMQRTQWKSNSPPSRLCSRSGQRDQQESWSPQTLWAIGMGSCQVPMALPRPSVTGISLKLYDGREIDTFLQSMCA